MRNIKDVYRLHKEELNSIKDEEQRYKRFVELNVEEQCINVMKTPEFQRAYQDRGILVHTWVFDIHSGKLIDLEIDFKKILGETMEVYKID